MPQNIPESVISGHDHFLDTSGLVCPLPVLKVRKALLSLGTGVILLVCMTDPDAPDDLRGLCRKLKAEIISLQKSKAPDTRTWMYIRTA